MDPGSCEEDEEVGKSPPTGSTPFPRRAAVPYVVLFDACCFLEQMASETLSNSMLQRINETIAGLKNAQDLPPAKP